MHRSRVVNRVDEDGNQRFHFHMPTELFKTIFNWRTLWSR
jgi:hypothetical protein